MATARSNTAAGKADDKAQEAAPAVAPAATTDGPTEVVPPSTPQVDVTVKVDGESTEVVEPPILDRAQDPTQTPTIVVDGRRVNPAVPDPRGAVHTAEPFISEGVAQDIERQGWARDGFTGKLLTREDLPEGRAEAKVLAPPA